MNTDSPDRQPVPTPRKEHGSEVDRVARLLIAEWECVEAPVTASYVTNFADMARVVLADQAPLRAKVSQYERDLSIDGDEFDIADLRAEVIRMAEVVERVRALADTFMPEAEARAGDTTTAEFIRDLRVILATVAPRHEETGRG